MARRWFAAILLAMVASSLITPVCAHTTIGNSTRSGPFRTNDHEMNPTNTFGQAHVPGPLGYVWPGSGLNTYSGLSTYPPGYQSPFTTFEQPSQVASSSYAPEGAILTSTSDHDSVGDLVFAINLSQPQMFATGSDPNPNFNYSAIAIYIPAPVFDKTGALVQDGFEPAGGIDWDSGENTNIVTTITDDYGSIFVTRADVNDPFQPGSWIVLIASRTGISFTSARDWKEWYYVRINQMKAPFVAGRYFFKIFLDNHYPVCSSKESSLINSTMPMENWPVLLVKGEVDPGMIWGTLRHGDLADETLYGLPISLPGRVRAVGFATNPTTGESTGRAVEARGYLNASANGHFEIEGVAPGTYSIFASAAGYPEQKIAENVNIFRGQSLMTDAHLKVGPEVRVEVFSKEGSGLVSWPGQRPISIVIYDSNTYDSNSIVTCSPTNLTHAPFTSYVAGNVAYSPSSGYTSLLAPNSPKRAAFPWEGPIALPAVPWVGSPESDVDGTVKDDLGLFNGVGPAQFSWVDPIGTDTNSGGPNSFRFQFGVRGFYGVPTKLSGMVPQVFATWTDSLSPGKYYVRVFVNGYVQTGNDGIEFVDCAFVLTDVSLLREISLPIDIWKSSTTNVTVHFHDLPGTMEDSPIGGPDPERFLIAEAFAGDGTLAAFNFTQVSLKDESASILLNGLGMVGPYEPLNIKYSLARYRGLHDYGLCSDTYTIHVFMRGYIQAVPPATEFEMLDVPLTVSISIGSGVVGASTHMYRGGGINATVCSVDWETPLVERKWLWNSASASILVYDIASRNFVDVIYFWNAKLNQWMIPKQNSDFDSLPWPGWKNSFGTEASYLVTNGSALLERSGPDMPSFPSKSQIQDKATTVFLQENFHMGFLYSSSSYRTAQYRSTLAIYPGAYAVNVWTYGYVQENVARLGDLGNIQVMVGWLGSQAETSIRLIIGVNFTIRMIFKTEDIFSGLPYNASIRVRVFDESDELVAAATLSSAKLSSETGFFADEDPLLFPRARTIPAGTRSLEYIALAGLLGYVEPSTGSERVQRATLFSPDHGVWGRSNYDGSYTGSWIIMVDFANWYRSTSSYPPVPALLQGESSFFFPYNHLGPYEQQTYAEIPNTVQGGEASVIFELDLRGYVQGVVLGPDWNDAIRTISWASVQFKTGTTAYGWYTRDGWFDGYLDPGDYQAVMTEWKAQGEGHYSYRLNLTVSAGEINRAMTVVLYGSGMPIPEFTRFSVIALSLTSLLGIVRGRRWLKRRR